MLAPQEIGGGRKESEAEQRDVEIHECFLVVEGQLLDGIAHGLNIIIR